MPCFKKVIQTCKKSRKFSDIILKAKIYPNNAKISTHAKSNYQSFVDTPRCTVFTRPFRAPRDALFLLKGPKGPFVSQKKPAERRTFSSKLKGVLTHLKKTTQVMGGHLRWTNFFYQVLFLAFTTLFYWKLGLKGKVYTKQSLC